MHCVFCVRVCGATHPAVLIQSDAYIRVPMIINNRVQLCLDNLILTVIVKVADEAKERDVDLKRSQHERDLRICGSKLLHVCETLDEDKSGEAPRGGCFYHRLTIA